MYGEQYQRSNSMGVILLGSSCEKASAGLVRALTKSWRNSPGLPPRSWATESGQSRAASCESPVVTMPVTVARDSRGPTLRLSLSPIAIPYFCATDAPATQSFESSPNHSPRIFHHGLVKLAPVTKVVPSSIGTECLYQVPMRVVWNLVVFSADWLMPACTGISRKGVKPRILWRQKIVLGWGRPEGEGAAPGSGGR